MLKPYASTLPNVKFKRFYDENEFWQNSENSNKNVWKFVIQTVINILAAVLTALGTTSCMGR